MTNPTLLVIILPTEEPDRPPPRLLSDDLKGFPVKPKNCHYLLIDTNNTALYNCDVNYKTVDAVARFITKNQSAKLNIYPQTGPEQNSIQQDTASIHSPGTAQVQTAFFLYLEKME